MITDRINLHRSIIANVKEISMIAWSLERYLDIVTV
jgi:hypothetical protein